MVEGAVGRARRQASSRDHASSGARYSLLLLAGLSGAAGLAYEALYLRVFSTLLGGGYLLGAIALAAVFAGIAVGAWNSQRFVRHLPWIELAVGVFAVALALIWLRAGFGFATLGGTSIAAHLLRLSLLLFLPMVLIGISLPVFARLVEATGTGQGAAGAESGQGLVSAFSLTYAVYNGGAVGALLLAEFVLLRQLGMTTTLLLLAVLNGLIVLALLRLRMVRARLRTAGAAQSDADNGTRSLFDPVPAVWLAFVGLGSGMFQLLVLRLSHLIFGPVQENFAIVVASALTGVAIGALWARRRQPGCQDLSLRLCGALLIWLLTVPLFLHLWSAFGDVTGTWRLVLKSLLLGLWPLPVFVLVGAAVPVALAAHRTSTPGLAGRLLALGSLSNGSGVLLAGGLMLAWLDLDDSILLAAALFGLPAVLFVSWRGLRSSLTSKDEERVWPVQTGRTLGMLVIGAGLIWSGQWLWPDRALQLGYRTIAVHDDLQARLAGFDRSVQVRHRDQNAAVVWFSDGSQILTFNGYRSLTFLPDSRSPLREMIVGATPALFSRQSDRALVLGLGTGISAGSTAAIYRQTEIVEINPAMPEIANRFTAFNNDVLNRQGAHIRIADGLQALLDDGPAYDAIINTVTSPVYYASAKLYTVEFLERVKARLAPGGAYSGWFDLNIGLDGIAIMLNTLEASFAKCRYFLLAQAYFNVVCGDGPLLYQASHLIDIRMAGTRAAAEISARGFTGDFSRFGQALERAFTENQFARSTDARNHLDRPMLEGIWIGPGQRAAVMQGIEGILSASGPFGLETVPGGTGRKDPEAAASALRDGGSTE